MAGGTLSLFAAAAVLGLVHGAEPGHGWPIAATYALDRSHRWLSGLTAALVIGVGHLISSIAVVAVFFLAASVLDVTQFGWVRYVAGGLLVLLGIREYRHGHSHEHGGHGHGHSHEHDDAHDGEPSLFTDAGDTPGVTGVVDSGGSHDHADELGTLGPIVSALPFVGGTDDGHSHGHGGALDADDSRGLAGLASAAFVLGFAHEEEFEILGFCTGATRHCLDLMLVYAFAVVFALVALTLLLVAGYERYEERVERYAEHFPTVSAVVLVVMGLGFIAGVL
jgi:ABC-type nickel/cobalt efflux system permease component RcnA